VNLIEIDIVNPIRISKQFIIIIIITIITICVSCIIIITSLYNNICIYTLARRGTIGHGENVVVARRVFVIMIHICIYYLPMFSRLIAQSCPRTGFFVFRSVSTVHNIIIVTIHLAHKRAQQ